MSILVTGIVTALGAAAGATAGYNFSRPQEVSTFLTKNPKTTIAAFALAGAAALGAISLCGESFKKANDYVKDYSATTSAANKAKLCVGDTPKGSTVTFIKSADGKITCDYQPK